VSSGAQACSNAAELRRQSTGMQKAGGPLHADRRPSCRVQLLFVAQSAQRIDARGAPGRDVSGGDGEE
jgi:hypothetical protein